MNAPHQNRPYTLVRNKVGDGFRTDFVLACASCGAEASVHADPQSPPNIIVQKFERMGWYANERNERGCFCPACLKKPGPRDKAKAGTLPVDPAAPAGTTTAEPEKARQPAAELPRGPTHAQRKTIAAHLRGCFDEARGCYLDGENDQRIGERFGIPWGWVREVRDLLGFEIRTDEEIEGLRAEIEALADMALALDRKLTALQAKRIAS